MVAAPRMTYVYYSFHLSDIIYTVIRERAAGCTETVLRNAISVSRGDKARHSCTFRLPIEYSSSIPHVSSTRIVII